MFCQVRASCPALRLFSTEQASADAKAGQAPEPKAEQNEDAAKLAALEADLKKTRTSLEESEKKAKQLNDQYLRALAEMQNVRNIAQKDVSNAKQYAVGGFSKDLLEVADTLKMV